MIECISCGRRLTNEEGADNQAHWTGEPMQLPYCGDSADCQRDAEMLAIIEGPWLCRHGTDLAMVACDECIAEKTR